VIELQAVDLLNFISKSVSHYWATAPLSDGRGVFKARRFPAKGSGWFPASPCCSYRHRSCPGVKGEAPPPWSDMSWLSLKGSRYFQLRYFSSGVAEKSTFVADAKGDIDCDGRVTWFRVRGRVTGKELKVEVGELEVRKGRDPRQAPLAAVEVLHRVLTGDEAILHAWALRDLEKHGSRARPVALKLINSKEARLRSAAARLMWKGPVGDLPLLAALLRDPDEDLRRDMVHEFALRGKKRPQLLPHLAALLLDKDAGLVFEAAESLCRTTGPQGVHHVVSALGHADPKVRKGLAGLIGGVARDKGSAGAWAAGAADGLGKLLGDGDNSVRVATVEALSHFKGHGIDHLVRALKNSSGEVRNHAVHHLARQGTAAASALPALRALLKATKKPLDRAVIAEAIMKLEGKMAPGSGMARVGSTTGVKECDEFLRKYEACVRSGMPQAAWPAMTKALTQMRKSYRQAARNPAARKALGQGCKRGEEATKKAMAAFKCKW